MAIANQQFWYHWRKGEYEQALACPVTEAKKTEDRLQTMLFGNQKQMQQTGAITTISVGELIYDYMMINPTVVEGLDFARTEDLSSLFGLSQFSSGIDTKSITGDIAQLQGYVAEQMLALELQAKGHEVEFTAESNNPGWDILIDGQPFQVKCLASAGGVREHLEKYPDIPVYVNEELARFFEGNPNVYISNISREDVLEATTNTISHADDLLDFEIPWIAAGVSTLFNTKKVWKDDVTINQAVFNVISDTSSRVFLGGLGQKAGIVVGTMLFGPAGGITGAMVGSFTGASQGGRLSTGVKRVFSKKQEQELIEAVTTLIKRVETQIDKKQTIKKRKYDDLICNLIDSTANDAIKKEATLRFKDEMGYLVNKKEELSILSNAIYNRSKSIVDVFPNMMAIIIKSGVHPVHYQGELKKVQEKSKLYLQRF